MPLELLDKKKLIESLLAQQKQTTSENIELVNLNGQCPDDRLLETGKFKESSGESFEGKKMIDQQNESRPS